MAKRLQRVAAFIRLGGIFIIVALLGVVAYYLYDFYSGRVVYTAPGAIDSYFTALANEDFDEVYRMTSKESLTDIYGRPITKGEFVNQLRRMTGEEPLPFQSLEANKLFERGDRLYFEVILTSSVGGEIRDSRLLIELQRVNNQWVVTYPFAVWL